MVAHVLRHEPPIYEDLLIERIARAHGFQRSAIGYEGPSPRSSGSSIVGRKTMQNGGSGRRTGFQNRHLSQLRAGCSIAWRRTCRRTCKPCHAVHPGAPIGRRHPLQNGGPVQTGTTSRAYASSLPDGCRSSSRGRKYCRVLAFTGRRSNSRRLGISRTSTSRSFVKGSNDSRPR